tara:strand:- start:128 stop:463 length:336 start_codon:yes stop_codon:yes gene_type:complete
METTVKVKHLRQSPTKLRFVLNELRGLKVDNAINMLNNSNKKAAGFILKAINSGLSNLDNSGDFDQDKVIISNAYVDGGPVMKRFRPRAMGRASQILKRTSHLTITLSEKG